MLVGSPAPMDREHSVGREITTANTTMAFSGTARRVNGSRMIRHHHRTVHGDLQALSLEGSTEQHLLKAGAISFAPFSKWRVVGETIGKKLRKHVGKAALSQSVIIHLESDLRHEVSS